MSSAQYNRSLTTIKTELEFLLDSEVITQSLHDHIIQCIPDKYSKGMPAKDFTERGNDEKEKPAVSETSTDSTPAYQPPASQIKYQAPSAPPMAKYIDYVEALYDFQPQQADDLQLYAGDKIQVTEKTSEAWWKGTCNSRCGMFPSNYVRSLNEGESSRNSPAPSYYQPPPQQQMQQQFPPQQGYYQQQQPMQVYSAPQQTPQQPMVMQVAQPTQQQQQQESSGSGSALKSFGSKLGNAAIFGAGATIGSDIVNSIF